MIEWYSTDDGTTLVNPDTAYGYALYGTSTYGGPSSLVSISRGSQVAITDAGYVQVFVQAPAPLAAVRGRLVVEILATAGASEVFYVGRASFAPGSSLLWRPGGNAYRQSVRIERSSDDGATWEQIAAGITPDYWQQLIYEDRRSACPCCIGPGPTSPRPTAG
jgi:hypothetical protein